MKTTRRVATTEEVQRNVQALVGQLVQSGKATWSGVGRFFIKASRQAKCDPIDGRIYTVEIPRIRFIAAPELLEPEALNAWFGEGNTVVVPGLGMLHRITLMGVSGRNRETGEEIRVPPSTRVLFRPTRRLKEQLTKAGLL